MEEKQKETESTISLCEDTRKSKQWSKLSGKKTNFSKYRYIISQEKIKLNLCLMLRLYIWAYMWYIFLKFINICKA